MTGPEHFREAERLLDDHKADQRFPSPAALEAAQVHATLSEVRDWLRSDWRPLGSPLTDSAAEARREVLRLAGQIKSLIDEAKGMLQREDSDG